MPPLALSHVDVRFQLDAAASAILPGDPPREPLAKTGVEMGLDLVNKPADHLRYGKAVDRGMVIGEVRLLENKAARVRGCGGRKGWISNTVNQRHGAQQNGGS